jgi:ABC-type methionine transport system ATPase subunit
VNVPTPPTAADRHDQSAYPGTWLLDNALAYVSQNPWIENATVKANILLGLPYLESRYRQVLYASSLEKDLDTWPNKDETEIGAQGVNLSGGQKWRVAFARALYSRASVLVVDDIFSALDAHTSRHVFEYGLTGEVAEGRTRILATHHVGLCLPGAEYCVVLDQGRVLQAGTVEVLAKTNILSHFSQPPEAGKDETENLASNARQSEDDAPSPRSAPLRFMQDEGRATGSNAWALYGRYLMSGNRVTPWAFAILAFTIYTFLFIGRVSLLLSKIQPVRTMADFCAFS